MSETRRVTLERVWDAAIEDVWELWTTKEGIESWWGPGGFDVTVHELDLRPGGTLDYTMSARDEGAIAYLRSVGRPTSTRHRATYTEVVPLRRLAYEHVVDFFPGAEPYEVTHFVELTETPSGVRMVLTFDAMHDDETTRLAMMGWESELEKLAAALSR